MAKKTSSNNGKTGRTRKNTGPQPQKRTAASGPQQGDKQAAGLFPIVGVGASAGGLEAFSELLRKLPANPGMAFVFVQHLDPKHVSMLAELLARESRMPVAEARDGVRVERDRVYVIPRNTSISIVKGVLKLSPREMAGGSFTSIDMFLRSLAEEMGPRAVGVLLSGNASDGSLGLKAIKAAGGITFAQDPTTAKYDGMPRSAIAAGGVDFVRVPAAIAHELVQLGEHAYSGMRSTLEGADPAPGSEDTINRILTIVRTATDMDFSHYKISTIRRRILRRMVLRRVEDLEKYLALLRSDPSEVHALYEDILINVTEFFRDPDAYEAFARMVFPRIVQQNTKSGERRIRCWVPGCSTGEEAYSIAIELLEFLGDESDQVDIQIFGTDISESALEKARTGVYPLSIKPNVSPERLRRFFIKSDSGYQIHKRVRELCIFARHNVAKDPPFSRLDVISCRNVLIYLGPVLQQRVIPMFHYALKSNGFLLLGSSETVGAHADLFQLVDKKFKIYQRSPVAPRIVLDLPVEKPAPDRPDLAPKAEIVTEYDLQREADRLVINKYGPPGVVVDDDMNILQFRGDTSPFLGPASGVASLNLLKMLKGSLAVEVKHTLAKSRKDNKALRREGVQLDTDGLTGVDVEVIPFKRLTGRDRKFLVVFEPTPAKHAAALSKGRRNPPPKGTIEQENAHLRQELAATREYLQSIVEDQEAAQEELRSAAEEIQSSNEELQSTNEELETAKEELQSTNEELNTVNEELQSRNMQLTQVGNDLLNLLWNVNMPVVILSNDLRIRRFTPVAERLNLIPSDVGRPIADISLLIRVPNLEPMLRDVVENLSSKVLEVADGAGRAYSLRLRPYRTEDNKIDGVVMVFVDVDPVMRAAEENPAHWAMPSAGGNVLSGAALLFAQEEERRRLAHELHDELNQKVALLELTAQNLSTQAAGLPDPVRQDIRGILESVSSLGEDLRRVAYQLHPAILDDLGLIPALQSYCEEFSARERIQVRLSHHDIPADLPSSVALVCYRVLQESLRNVAKHSGAKRASVTLGYADGRLGLTIRDGGSGFHMDSTPTGLGIRGMRERVSFVGGTIQWRSKPGEGTQVIASIPMAVGAAGEA
jgi:two-component system, chemotaxis family, CheB/CheR fusion protein